MLDDGDKAVSYDCRANLYSDSVFCSAPEFLNFEMLLEPLEEQLNLPSVLVEIGNFESGKMDCIRQKCEVSILLVIVKSHKSKLLRILLLCVHIREFNNGIRKHKISIGDNFYFTSGDAANPISSNLRGTIFTDCPDARILIGDNVGMSSTRMWIHDSLTIGNNVNIGACVPIIDTDCHEMDYRVRNHSLPPSGMDGQYVKSAPITIEDHVWIGAHSIILKGVTIGARSVIGAGSVVTKSIPADCIAAGNPCRVIRMLSHG